MKQLIATLSLVLIAGCNNGPAPYVDSNAPPIVIAAQRSDMNTVKAVLDSNAAALNHKDANGNAAASWAILNDHRT